MPVDLVTADLQLADNPRDDYRHAFVKRLPKLANKYKADRIIILGDLTEEKDRHSARLVNKIVDHFYALTDGREVIFLRGNHDYLDQEHPFFRFLRRLPLVQYINKPTVIGNDLFLPHTLDYKKDWEGLLIPGCKRIFAHNTFEGALGNNNVKLEGIPTNIFPKGVSVYAGDIHTPQKVGPVVYVGAPYTVDFGDNYDPRVLLLKNKSFASVRVGGPQKRLLDYHKRDDGSWSLMGREKARKGDIVKIRVHIEQEDRPNWYEYKKVFQDWAERDGLKVHMIQPVVSQEVTDRIVTTGVRSDEEVLLDYAHTKGLDKHTLQVGKSFL